MAQSRRARPTNQCVLAFAGGLPIQGGAEFGRGLLRLQIEIDLVQRRERLSGRDNGADLDQTL